MMIIVYGEVRSMVSGLSLAEPSDADLYLQETTACWLSEMATMSEMLDVVVLVVMGW